MSETAHHRTVVMAYYGFVGSTFTYAYVVILYGYSTYEEIIFRAGKLNATLSTLTVADLFFVTSDS